MWLIFLSQFPSWLNNNLTIIFHAKMARTRWKIWSIFTGTAFIDHFEASTARITDYCYILSQGPSITSQRFEQFHLVKIIPRKRSIAHPFSQIIGQTIPVCTLGCIPLQYGKWKHTRINTAIQFRGKVRMHPAIQRSSIMIVDHEQTVDNQISTHRKRCNWKDVAVSCYWWIYLCFYVYLVVWCSFLHILYAPEI